MLMSGDNLAYFSTYCRFCMAVKATTVLLATAHDVRTETSPFKKQISFVILE